VLQVPQVQARSISHLFAAGARCSLCL